jgi:hypothetical protein
MKGEKGKWGNGKVDERWAARARLEMLHCERDSDSGFSVPFTGLSPNGQCLWEI